MIYPEPIARIAAAILARLEEARYNLGRPDPSLRSPWNEWGEHVYALSRHDEPFFRLVCELESELRSLPTSIAPITDLNNVDIAALAIPGREKFLYDRFRKPKVVLISYITTKNNLVLEWLPANRADVDPRPESDHPFFWQMAAPRGAFEGPFNRILMIREFDHFRWRNRRHDRRSQAYTPAEQTLLRAVVETIDHIIDVISKSAEVVCVLERPRLIEKDGEIVDVVIEDCAKRRREDADREKATAEKTAAAVAAEAGTDEVGLASRCLACENNYRRTSRSILKETGRKIFPSQLEKAFKTISAKYPDLRERIARAATATARVSAAPPPPVIPPKPDPAPRPAAQNIAIVRKPGPKPRPTAVEHQPRHAPMAPLKPEQYRHDDPNPLLLLRADIPDAVVRVYGVALVDGKEKRVGPIVVRVRGPKTDIPLILATADAVVESINSGAKRPYDHPAVIRVQPDPEKKHPG